MKLTPIRFKKADAAPRRKKRLKYIAVLPSLITLLNGVCGFIAIIFACRSQEPGQGFFFVRGSIMSYIALAGYLIFFGMIADMLDGRVARLTRTTSSFGGQLDSLCDVISFGIAPAFLMLNLVEFHLAHLSVESQKLSTFLGRVVFVSAIFYVICAILRLARFNVENEENESAHMNFSGLPSPAAAGVVASLVVFQQQILVRVTDAAQAFHILEICTVIVLPVITLLAGILMISRVHYPHVANQLLSGKKPLPVFVAIFAAGLFIVWNIQLALVIGFCGFAFWGFIRWILASIFRKKIPSHAAVTTEQKTESGEQRLRGSL